MPIPNLQVLSRVTYPGSNATVLMVLRWIHFLAGITWIGLLYFFNLVNVEFVKGLDPSTRARVLPRLMRRSMWWFRWSALVTVLAGMAYWMNIVTADSHNAQASPGRAIWSLFVIWTVAFVIQNALVMPLKGPLNNGWVLAVLMIIVVGAASCFYLRLNDHGWESNRMLSIGIGGGIGWLLMMNVWGIVWRVNKKLILWTEQNLANGTPIPQKAEKLARQGFLVSRISFWLTIPLLFLMGTASHYPFLGK